MACLTPFLFQGYVSSECKKCVSSNVPLQQGIHCDSQSTTYQWKGGMRAAKSNPFYLGGLGGNIYIMTHLTSVGKSVNSKCSVVVPGTQILVNQKRNGKSLVQQCLSKRLKLKAMLIILNFTNCAANWS